MCAKGHKRVFQHAVVFIVLVVIGCEEWPGGHDVPTMERSDTLGDLRAFRDSLYECFERRSDALFELIILLIAGASPRRST